MSESDQPNPLLLFACVRAEMCGALEQELLASNLRTVVTSDPRRFRAVAAEEVVAAVVLDRQLAGPPVPELAMAYAAALPPETAFILLTDELAAVAEPPFDAVVRVPCGPGVLRDVVMRAVGRRWTDLDAPARSMAEEVAERAAKLGQQNHYEVLGLPDDVPMEAIVAAFDRLSLRLHPERLPLNEAAAEQANEVYARICEAYRTLRTPLSREAYDLQLRSSHAPDAGSSVRHPTLGLSLEELSTHPIARRHLRIAQQALAVRDFAMAVAQMRFAASKDPDNALIPAQLTQLEERLRGASEHG